MGQLDPAQGGSWGRKNALLAKDFRTADAKHLLLLAPRLLTYNVDK